MSTGRKLPRRKEMALAALLSTSTLAAAAQAAGISERTLRAWRRTAEFAAEYRARRLEVVEHAVGILQSASLQAVLTLMKNLSCGRASAEISAANILLEKSLQAVEQFDVLSRLEALERAAQGANNHANRNAQTNGFASGGPGH